MGRHQEHQRPDEGVSILVFVELALDDAQREASDRAVP